VKVEIVSGSPNADELAAIAAALEKLLKNERPERAPNSRWRLAGREYTPIEQFRDWQARGSLPK
jgi:hypothetical protein